MLAAQTHIAMSKLKYSILFIVFGGVLTLGTLALVAWLQYRTSAAIALTRVQLITYRVATTNFFAMVNRWPASATELVSNSMDVVFISPSPPTLDGWGRPIAYEPYSTNAGCGRVVSYGRDGKMGGVGADADIEFRFP